MKTNKRYFLVAAIILLCIAFSANVKAQAKADDKESARIFVQKFYDWYLVLWSEAEKSPGSKESVLDRAIKKHPEYFGQGLKKAIAIDDSAQNKSGDIVGLDFDPFIGQELWGNFKAADVSWVDDKFLVNIRNIAEGGSAKETRAAELREVVEVTRRNGHWVITNIIYPSGDSRTDLLQTLKGLKKDRDKA